MQAHTHTGLSIIPHTWFNELPMADKVLVILVEGNTEQAKGEWDLGWWHV